MTDLFSPILLKIDIHVRFMMMDVLSNRFKKNSIGNCKCMQHTIFLGKICGYTVLTDLLDTSCQ